MNLYSIIIIEVFRHLFKDNVLTNIYTDPYNQCIMDNNAEQVAYLSLVFDPKGHPVWIPCMEI